MSKNITVVVTNKKETKKIILGKNIVTNDGDIYYARKIAGVPTDFTSPAIRLGSDSTTPSKTDTDVIQYINNTANTVDEGYPTTEGPTEDNPSPSQNTVVWRFTYGVGSLEASNITEAAIVDNGNSPTKAICRFLFSQPFDITLDDKLVIYVNHTFGGV